MIKLVEALRLKPDVCLALVGAGGKTSALFQIARQLPPPVFVTSTTHLSEEQLSLADRWWQLENPEEVEIITPQEGEHVLLFVGPPDGEGRRKGLPSPILNRLRTTAKQHRIALLIEADGSRQLPLKAPNEYEPALPFLDYPQGLDVVIVVAGLSSLGEPLNSIRVHRAERYAQVAAIPIGAPISIQSIARVLLHPEGGLKNIPKDVKKIVLLNQADMPELQSQANAVIGKPAGELNLFSAYDSVVVASLKSQKVWAVHEPIGGVILAAGGATRFGAAKQVLTWQDETLVHRAARTALESGLNPVIVVSGAYSAEIQAALGELPVQHVINPDWVDGQSTSVRAGVVALTQHIGGVVFMLVDQPLVGAELIRRLVETHAETLHPIVAPQAGGRRANPVLFDQRTFSDLLRLQGDQGGRQLFSKYAPTWVYWHDESILHEIDTPEDYQALLERETP